MTARKYRIFHADVTVNAPKERTLFNYNVKVSVVEHFAVLFIFCIGWMAKVA